MLSSRKSRLSGGYRMLTIEDLRGALPSLTGTVELNGLDAAAEVYRDEWGIPHVKAESELDAFFAQGFVTAQDRLWHMEYDRRRGSGRWAEVVGPQALGQDKLMRRFRLAASAKADYDACYEHTRRIFEAYAAGVNAYIEGPDPLPIEYQVTGLTPEPWQPWHSLVVYKVRHILMGVFESKAWRARMVKELGPERAGTLFPGYEPGHLTILPPGSVYSGALDTGLQELTDGARALNYLNEVDAGSNSWVLSGASTAAGKPLLAGDSHRALDTPNTYYQNQLACPEFDVVGLSFPGVPGFPHFGHNQWVSWCVTHTAADYQDLYIERFKEDDPTRYLFRDEWLEAETHQETVKARQASGGFTEETIEVTVTQHGPVIAGDPAAGAALAFKYTATENAAIGGGSAWPSILWQMLRAKNVNELVESQRDWVDPCNNFLMADVHGNYGYLCRGRIPIRSRTNGWLPVPGWTGEHEWTGDIPFEEMPKSINPDEGYVATANNKPVGDDYPHYIAIDFTPEFRCKSVTQGLLSLEKPAAPDMAKVHAQRVSIPALGYLAAMQGVKAAGPLAAEARERLLAWNGAMDAGAVEPTIYSAVRDALFKEALGNNLTPELAENAWSPGDRGLGSFGNRLKARLSAMIEQDDVSLLPPGDTWAAALSRALTAATATLRDRLGDDMEEWRWERVHQARPQHTLSAAYPELAGLLDPPPIPASGDGDTPLAGGYSPAAPATITTLSVARYCYDPADWKDSLWVVPLGSSGHPGSPHYCDQSDTWRRVEMVPMEWDWPEIERSAESRQRLLPG